MKIISAREGFWSDDALANKDAIRAVDLVGDKPSKIIEEDKFFEGIKGKRILIIIHGYNNGKEDVHSAYALIEKNVKKHVKGDGSYDEVIGYIWPGGETAINYYSAKSRANKLGRRVGLLFQRMFDNDVTVDVMGHSMGSRVILKALDTRAEKVVQNVFLLASAVDNECLEKTEKFYPATKRCSNAFVFHTKHDTTLSIFYRGAELDNALGLTGPENPEDIISHSSPSKASTPSVYVINCKNKIKRHGDYKREKLLYTYISQFISGSPADQFSTL